MASNAANVGLREKGSVMSAPHPQRTTGDLGDSAPISHVHRINECTVTEFPMWTPLAEVDWEVGGITFAEGLTEHVNRQEIEADGSTSTILPENMPEGCLRHTTYRPGDVLFMNCYTPHSGLTNVSDRFRLSLDHRVMRPGAKRPYVGAVVSIAPERIEVRDDSGVTAALAIDDTSYVRAIQTQRIFGQEVVDAFPPGTRVIVGHDNGVATLVRLTHQE